MSTKSIASAYRTTRASRRSFNVASLLYEPAYVPAQRVGARRRQGGLFILAYAWPRTGLSALPVCHRPGPSATPRSRPLGHATVPAPRPRHGPGPRSRPTVPARRPRHGPGWQNRDVQAASDSPRPSTRIATPTRGPGSPLRVH